MFPLAQYGDAMRDDRLEEGARQRLASSLKRRRTERQRRTFLRRLVTGLASLSSGATDTRTSAR
jgi:hypothetical protein